MSNLNNKKYLGFQRIFGKNTLTLTKISPEKCKKMAENAASDICRTRFLPGSCPIFHTNFFANCTKMDEYARIPRLCPTIFFVGPIFGRFLRDMSYVIEKLACKLRTIFARLDTIFARQFFKKFKKIIFPLFSSFLYFPLFISLFF